MEFEETPLPGLLVATPVRHGDGRGFFSEVWKASAWRERGIVADWCQDNHSLSRAAGVLRGLHCQAPPMAQTKLLRCTRGRMWDVAVDVRRGSPGYGRWFGLELSADNWRQLYVPRGFLHGFLTLEPDTEVQYKVDNSYAPDCDCTVRWDDPELAIEWPLTGLGPEAPMLSAKDAAAPPLARWESPFDFGDTE